MFIFIKKKNGPLKKLSWGWTFSKHLNLEKNYTDAPTQ
ncbi:MAG: hypothetical protein CM15mP75_7760 [Flammeovirgaceae bacterium]|nr:MAG: hypothetical protein CM15mP75_7760 [Flammeovirgaceae bacterium]